MDSLFEWTKYVNFFRKNFQIFNYNDKFLLLPSRISQQKNRRKKTYGRINKALKNYNWLDILIGVKVAKYNKDPLTKILCQNKEPAF